MFKKVFILAFMCPVILADCCRKKQVNFQLLSTGDNCANYEGAKNNVRRGNVGVIDAITGRCKVSVCGDGRKPKGTYCGKGSCNAFGCNCDGGCIAGDAVESFRANHRGAVRYANQDPIDSFNDGILNAVDVINSATPDRAIGN